MTMQEPGPGAGAGAGAKQAAAATPAGALPGARGGLPDATAGTGAGSGDARGLGAAALTAADPDRDPTDDRNPTDDGRPPAPHADTRGTTAPPEHPIPDPDPNTGALVAAPEASFEEAAELAAPALGGAGLRELAARVGAGWPDQAIRAASREEETIAALLAARRRAGVDTPGAAAFLRGLAAGYTRAAGAVSVETVWSGPASHAVPVRATAQALVEVIAAASRELVLMTYSARPHARIREALADAAARGVRVDVVVETLHGAGGAIGGAEPASAFAGIEGVELWHWPAAQRGQPRAKAHAKLAAADRRVLLVSSANLTQSGVSDNIEAGLLVRGGEAPRRIAEHVAELRTRGVLAPLYHGGNR